MPREANVTVTLTGRNGEMLERFRVFGADTTDAKLAEVVRDTVESHHGVGPAVAISANVDEACDRIELAHDQLTRALERLKATVDGLR
jgi:hypothetical protein